MIAGQPWPTVAFLLAVAFVAGLARGFSGFGSALIFIPLGSAAVGPALASAVLLAVDGLGSTPMLPSAWKNADRRAVFTMSAGAVVAVPIGTIALAWIDPSTLRWGICVAILALVALLASGWRYAGQPSAPITVGVGLISGFLTGSAQIGGAPAIAYWLGGESHARNVRANLVLYLACSTIYSVIAYAISGLFNWRMAALSLAVGPVYVAGTLLGMRMFGLASQQAFRRACFALIALSAILGMPIFR